MAAIAIFTFLIVFSGSVYAMVRFAGRARSNLARAEVHYYGEAVEDYLRNRANPPT